MSINITIRNGLTRSLKAFSRNTGINIISNEDNLVELVILISRYQEEGKKLYPKLYITKKINELLKMLPGCEQLKIGESSKDIDGIKNVLKKCAPLASDGWMIYLNENNNNIDYGLFKGPSNPLSVITDDVFIKEQSKHCIVKVYKVSEECVEIKSNNGGIHYIFLDHRKTDSSSPLKYLDELVSLIMSKVKMEYIDPTRNILSRMLYEPLRESHGCIIAVTNMSKAPKFLSQDGIILDNPIDFGFLVEELNKDIIKEHIISSKEQLLRGMLNSDGVILFDNQARILGYNCFIKIKEREDVIGGARSRAFSSLKKKIGYGLCGVYMQSQDGGSDFKGIK